LTFSLESPVVLCQKIPLSVGTILGDGYHTSASLVVSESYDPSAKIDLEEFMERLVPENQRWFRHTLEGSDDSPSHMRAMLTHTSLSIPIDHGNLSIGTWQGLYLFEHRSRPHRRKVLIRCLSIE
jgi:secondary thiamine-phosphate synthase enzyme